MSTRMNKVIVSVIIVMLVLFILALVSGIVNQETIAGQAIKLGGGNFLNPGAKLGDLNLKNNVGYIDVEFNCNNGKKFIPGKFSKLCKTEKDWQDFALDFCKESRGFNKKNIEVNKKITCRVSSKDSVIVSRSNKKTNKNLLLIKDIPKKIIKVIPEEDLVEKISEEEVSEKEEITQGVNFGQDVIAELIEEPQNSVQLTEGSIANYYSVDKIDGLTFKLEKELYSENVMLKHFVNGEWVDLNIEKINEDKNFVYYRLNE